MVRVVPEARLRLHGHGSGKSALQELVKQLGLEASVQVNDFVQDVPAVYESAGLSLLTSQGEGYPLVVVESLSHGCPMIAFDVNYGPSEIIDDGETGFLLPFKEESLLAERIITLLRDPERHRRMSDAARRASSRFRMETVAEKWRTLLTSITTSKEPPMTWRKPIATGTAIRAAYSMLEQLGLGEIGRIEFDWKQNALVLSPHERIRQLDSEASQALESVLRVLKIAVSETRLTPIESNSSMTTPTATNSADRESRWPTEAAGVTDSATRQTDRLRDLLPPLFTALRVTRLMDVGCGNVSWIREVAFDGHLHYFGVDVDEALIERNRRRFG